MPTYECCVIFGNLISGGLIMDEFAQYSYRNLVFIGVGCSLCMLGIMYKVCTLETADVLKIESDKFSTQPEGQEIEMTLNSKKKTSDEKFMKVSDSNDDLEFKNFENHENANTFDEIIKSLQQ